MTAIRRVLRTPAGAPRGLLLSNANANASCELLFTWPAARSPPAVPLRYRVLACALPDSSTSSKCFCVDPRAFVELCAANTSTSCCAVRADYALYSVRLEARTLDDRALSSPAQLCRSARLQPRRAFSLHRRPSEASCSLRTLALAALLCDNRVSGAICSERTHLLDTTCTVRALYSANPVLHQHQVEGEGDLRMRHRAPPATRLPLKTRLLCFWWLCRCRRTRLATASWTPDCCPFRATATL